MEFNLECPEDLADEVLEVTLKCMKSGGRPFCPNVNLEADGGIYDYWVH